MSVSKRKDNLDALIMSAAHVLVDDAADYMRSIDTSETVISKSLDKRVYRKIRKHRRDRWWSSVPVACKKVVAAIMIFCTISFAMSMSVEAVREEVWNTILEWYDKFVAVFYVTEETPPSVIEEYREPTLQLAGTDRKSGTQTDIINQIFYMENEAVVMIYQQSIIGNESTDLDSEQCTLQEIEISDAKAKLFTYDNGTKTITWHDGQYMYIIYTYVEINDDLLINIADSVK